MNLEKYILIKSNIYTHMKYYNANDLKKKMPPIWRHFSINVKLGSRH